MPDNPERIITFDRREEDKAFEGLKGRKIFSAFAPVLSQTRLTSYT